MAISNFKVRAYSVLVRAGKYILDEVDRETPEQILVPSEYKEPVVNYLAG